MTSLVTWWSELLLSMRSRVRFPVLPWEFSLTGEDTHSDRGLGSQSNLGLRSFLVLHAHTYHSHHHRGNVTASYGRTNLRSRCASAATRRGNHEVFMDMWSLGHSDLKLNEVKCRFHIATILLSKFQDCVTWR
jgi:hypothetical protein